MLVNAGGFARNQAMRDRYAPGTSVKWTMAAPGDTGEMIEEMMRHGAAIAQMEERVGNQQRSEEHTSELQSLMRISYAVFCLKKKKQKHTRYLKQKPHITK